MRLLLAVVAALAFLQQDPKVEEAIRGLGADSFEDREKATAELKKIGAPALEALKKAAADSQDPEVRARAQRLVQDIDKPAAPKAPMSRVPRVFSGSRIAIRRAGDDTIYSFQPAEGDAIEFHRGPEGKVKLVYPDSKGGKSSAEAESVEKFLGDYKELAEKYGITKEGVDYGGTKLKFDAPFGVFAFPRTLEIPVVPMAPDLREFDDLFGQSEELRKAFEDLRRQTLLPQRWGVGSSVLRGAAIGAVPDVLRAHLAIPEGQGVVVESVFEGSTAAAAGLKRHDILLEIDGKKISAPNDVRTLLKRDSKVKAIRGGKEIDVQPAPPPKKDY